MAESYQQKVVKPGSSAELPCRVRSNLAQVLWKVNGSVLTEAARFFLMKDTSLLIYSVAPEDQGRYECWSVEEAAGKNFTHLVAGFDLQLDLPKSSSSSSSRVLSSADIIEEPFPDTSTLTESRGDKGNSNGNIAGPPLLTTTEASPLTPPAVITTTSSNINSAKPQPKLSIPPEASDAHPRPETLDPSAKYLQYDNSSALLALFLLFFLLFLCALCYNCYMQYLPAPCLRLRSALLGSPKKPQPEYIACEAGLMEAIPEKPDLTEQLQQNGAQQQLRALRDTGYETETECGNGKIPSHSYEEADDSASKERPFDIDCESQPIEYADADVPY